MLLALIAVGVCPAQITPSPAGAWLSADGGATWSVDGAASGLGTLPYTPPGIGLYCSSNAGSTWTPCTNGSSFPGVTSDGAGGIIANHIRLLSNAPNQLISYGDSVTACVGPTNLADCWINRWATNLGASLTNRGVAATMACDTSQNITSDPGPTNTPVQPLRTLMIGINDANTKGAGAYEATFNKCDQAMMAWWATPASSKALGTTATRVGGCNTTNISSYCGSLNSTITFSSFVTTGGPIYLWYNSSDGWTATFTCTVDGAQPVNLTANLTPSISTLTGGTGGTVLYRWPTVAAGSHTVQCTNTNGASYMSIAAIGTPPSLTTVPYNAQPYLVVGNIMNTNNHIDAAAVTAYNADVAANVSLFQGDGLDIIPVNVYDYVQATTAAGDMTDTFHPNNLGSVEILNAYQGSVGFVPANSGAAVFPIQTVSASYPMHEGTGLLFNEVSNNSSLTMPASGGSWGSVAGFSKPVFTFNGTSNAHATAAAVGNTNIDGNVPMTLHFKVRPSNLSAVSILFGNTAVTTTRGWEIYIDTLGYLTLQIINTVSTNHLSVRTAQPLAANTTYTVDMVYDGSRNPYNVKWYINGIPTTGAVLVNTLTATSASTQPLVVSGRQDNTLPFSGVISDLTIIPANLSYQSVLALQTQTQALDTVPATSTAFYCGTTTTCSNTQQYGYKPVWGTVSLTAGSAVVTAIPAFSSTTSYLCRAWDLTTIANTVSVANTSTTSITLTGTGTDSVGYQCNGN